MDATPVSPQPPSTAPLNLGAEEEAKEEVQEEEQQQHYRQYEEEQEAMAEAMRQSLEEVRRRSAYSTEDLTWLAARVRELPLVAVEKVLDICGASRSCVRLSQESNK